MTPPDDPLHSTDDPAAPRSLAGLVLASRGYGPSEAELAALTERLAPQLESPPAAAPPLASPASWWLRLTGVAALVGVVAVAVAARPRPQPPTTAAPVASHLPPPAAPTTPQPEAPAVVAAPGPPPEPLPLPERPAAVVDHPRPPAPCDPAAHLAAVDSARVALRQGDLRRSLSTAAADRLRCPRGDLSEEREGIAIEALARLGRRDEAARRLAEFSREHPDSLHLRSLRAALDGGLPGLPP